MLPKPVYNAVLQRVRKQLDDQRNERFVAISMGWFTTYPYKVQGKDVYVRDRDLEGAWPYIVKALGLVDDGTGTRTWTLPGRAIDVEVERARVMGAIAKLESRMVCVDCGGTKANPVRTWAPMGEVRLCANPFHERPKP